MAETRLIIGHAQHKAQGPHIVLPADFEALRLHHETEQTHIEVTCSAAIVGRHTDADLRFASLEVSRRHCRIAFENGLWRIYDLKSLNGTYVNNSPIVEATLYTGDSLRLGNVNLLVECGTPLRTPTAQEEKLRQIAEVLPVD